MDADNIQTKVDKRVSRVSVAESKFHIDGVSAEMIVEVADESENNISCPSHSKLLTGTNHDEEIGQDEATASDDSLKVDFAKNLGLVCPSQEESDSLDKTKTKSEEDKNETSQSDGSPKAEPKKNKDVKKKKRRSGVFLKKLPKKKKTVKVVNTLVISPGKGKKLDSISCISENLLSPKTQGIKPLYRVLFNSYPVQSQDEIKNQILQFSGFTFEESSSEYNKRKSILRVLPLSSLQHICNILELKCDEKPSMITSILDFLKKPYDKIKSSTNFVLNPDLPVLRLKRIDHDPRFIKKIDNGYVTFILKEKSSSLENKIKLPASSGRPKRSIIKKEDLEFVKDIKFIKKVEVTKHITRKSRGQLLISKGQSSISKGQSSISKGQPSISKGRPSISKGRPSISKESNVTPKGGSKPKAKLKSSPKLQQQFSAIKQKKKEIKVETNIKSKRSLNEDENFNLKEENNMSRRTAEKRKKPDHYGEWMNDDSSDTKSADEIMAFEDIDSSSVSSVKEKPKEKRISLSSFPTIKRNIESASTNVIERLHVIVFGNSCESEKMRQNLLNFNGFNMAPGSEEWKQKTFFLSLVANNYLLEVTQILNLDINRKADAKLVSTTEILMNFLRSPASEYLVKEDINCLDQKLSAKTSTPLKIKFASKSISKSSKVKKEKTKPTGNVKRRKMLMDESEVRKLELEIAREERAKKRTIMHNPSFSGSLSLDYDQDYAHSQAKSMLTVIKNNRALKAAGIDPIAPSNTSRVHKLGDNSHVQFMIVALNYPDLEILHNLIFLHDAVKSRIRKNILEFGGFKFDESSENYKFRETFLQRLGSNIVKRISFIFGLTPLNTTLPFQDVIDLIMHFLMSPSKAKQVPIKEFPPNFFQDYPLDYDKKAIFQGISGELLDDNVKKPTDQRASPIIVTPDIHADLDDDVGIPIAEVYNNDPPPPKPIRSTPVHSILKSSVQPQTAIRSPKPIQNTPPLFILQPQIPGQPSTPVTTVRPAFPPNTPIQFQFLKNAVNSLPTPSPGSKVFFVKVPQPVGSPLPPLKLISNPPGPPLSLPPKSTSPIVIAPPSLSKPTPQPVKLTSSPEKIISTPASTNTTPKRIPRAMKSFPNASRIETYTPLAKTTVPRQDSPEPEEVVLSSEEDNEDDGGIICHKSQFEQDVFLKIRDIILASSMEDITLKKITEKLKQIFPSLDTAANQGLIKNSIKKVICSMASSTDD